MNQDSLYQAFQRYNQAKALNDRVKQIEAGTYVDPMNQGYASGASGAASGLTGTALADEEQQTLNALSNLNTLLNGRNIQAGLESIQGANDVIESAVQYGNRGALEQAGDVAKSIGQGAVESVGGLATLGALPFGQAENVGNFVNGLDQAIDATKSDSYQAGNLFKQYRSQAINNWADRTYGENPTGIKSLAKLGHTVIKQAENMTGSEVLEGMGNLVGQVGSTVGAGKLVSLAGTAATKGLGIAGKLAAKTAPLTEGYNAFRTGLATKGGFLGRQAADMLSGSGLRNTTFLAAQEMGAAANQIVSDTANVSNDQLYNTSTAYRQLVDSYMNQGMGINDAMNQARKDLINSLASQAAFEATPGAIAAGIAGDRLAAMGKRALNITKLQKNRVDLYNKHQNEIETKRFQHGAGSTEEQKAIANRDAEFVNLALNTAEQQEYAQLTAKLQQAVANGDKATIQQIYPRYQELEKKIQNAVKDSEDLSNTLRANSFAGKLEEAITHPVKSTTKTIGEVGAEASGEAAAEYFSNRGVNKIAQENYDPDRDINEGVAESMAQAFVSTGALGGAKKAPVGTIAGTSLAGHAAYKAAVNPATRSVFNEIKTSYKEHQANQNAKADKNAEAQVKAENKEAAENAKREATGEDFAQDNNAEVRINPNPGSIDVNNGVSTDTADAAKQGQIDRNKLQETTSEVFIPKGESNQYSQASYINNGQNVDVASSIVNAAQKSNQNLTKPKTEPVKVKEQAIKEAQESETIAKEPVEEVNESATGLNKEQSTESPLNTAIKTNTNTGTVEKVKQLSIDKNTGELNEIGKKEVADIVTKNYPHLHLHKKDKATEEVILAESTFDDENFSFGSYTFNEKILSEADKKLIADLKKQMASYSNNPSNSDMPADFNFATRKLKRSDNFKEIDAAYNLEDLNRVFGEVSDVNHPNAKDTQVALQHTANAVLLSTKSDKHSKDLAEGSARTALRILTNLTNNINAKLENPSLAKEDRDKLNNYFDTISNAYAKVIHAILDMGILSADDINKYTQSTNFISNSNNENTEQGESQSSTGSNINVDKNYDGLSKPIINANHEIDTTKVVPDTKDNLTPEQRIIANELFSENKEDSKIDAVTGKELSASTKNKNAITKKDAVANVKSYNALDLDKKEGNPSKFLLDIDALKKSNNPYEQKAGYSLEQLSGIYDKNLKSKSPYAKAINSALNSLGKAVNNAHWKNENKQGIARAYARIALVKLTKTKNNISVKLNDPFLSKEDREKLSSFYMNADESYSVAKQVINNTIVPDSKGNPTSLLSGKGIAEALNDTSFISKKQRALTEQDAKDIQNTNAVEPNPEVSNTNELKPTLYETGSNDTVEYVKTPQGEINLSKSIKATDANAVNKLTAKLFNATYIFKSITGLINFNSATPIKDAFAYIEGVYKNVYEKTQKYNNTDKVDPVGFFQELKGIYENFDFFLDEFNNRVSTQLLDGGRFEEALNPHTKDHTTKKAFRASTLEGILNQEGMAILPFLEQVQLDGIGSQFTLNKHFCIPVMLATMKFVSDIPNFTNPVAPDKVLSKYKEFKDLETSNLSADKLYTLMNGTTRTVLVNHFADLLKNMTGFKNNDKISSSVDSQAQFKALANELLNILITSEDAKDDSTGIPFACLKQEVIPYTKADGKEGFISVITSYSKSEKDEIDNKYKKVQSFFKLDNKKMRRALDKVCDEISQNTDTIAYGKEKLKPTPYYQNGNKTPLSKEQKEALEKMQETHYFANNPFLSFLQQLIDMGGINAIAKLVVGVDNFYDEQGNVSDDIRATYGHSINTMAGRALTITSAVEKALEIDANLKDFGSGEQFVKFPVRVASNGRFMLSGASYTPQSSKVMRQAFSNVHETLNLNNAEEKAQFDLAVAMALGINPKKATLEQTQAKLAELDSFIKDNEKLWDNPAQLAEKFFKQFFDENYTRTDTKQEDIWAGLNALLVRKASLDSTDGTFINTLPIEIDASAKGLLDSLIQASGSETGSGFLYALRRAGFLFGNLTKPLLDKVKQSNNEEKDPYEKPGEMALGNIINHMNRFANTNEANKAYVEQFNAFIKAALNDYIEIKEDDSVAGLTRELLKKLVTSGNYGQGLDSSIETFISDVLFPRLAYKIDNKKANDDILKPFKYIVDHCITFNKKTKTYEVETRQSEINLEDISTKSLNQLLGKGTTGSAYNALYKALEHFIFSDLHTAIEKSQSPTFKEASDVMNNIFNIAAAGNRIQELNFIKKNKDDYGLNPSRKEYNEFLKKNCVQLVTNGRVDGTTVTTQSFEKTEASDSVIGKGILSLSGNEVGNGLPIDKAPGVSLSPRTIQNQDALMQQRAVLLAKKENKPLNGLNTFDGHNSPIKFISNAINIFGKASHEIAIKSNVLDAYADFFRQEGNVAKLHQYADMLASLSEDDKAKYDNATQALIKSAENSFIQLEVFAGHTYNIKAGDNKYNAAILRQLIDDAKERIDYLSEMQAIKQEALEHLPITVAHMTTGSDLAYESYYKVNSDTPLAQAMQKEPGKTEDFVKEFFNEAYYQASLYGKDSINWSEVENKAISNVTGTENNSVSIKPQDIVTHKLTGLDLDTDIAKKLSDFLSESGIKVYYEDAREIKHYVSDFNSDALGCYDAENNAIWINKAKITDKDNKTLTHEYIHALITGSLHSLAEKTKGKVQGDTKAEQAYLDMVANLHNFKEFFNTSSKMDEDWMKLYRLFKVIEPMNDVDAINELLAYTLSDPSIQEAFKNKGIQGRAPTKFEQAIEIIKQLWAKVCDLFKFNPSKEGELALSFVEAAKSNFLYIASEYTKANESKLLNAFSTDDSTVDSKSFLDKLQNNITISNTHIPEANKVSKTNPFIKFFDEKMADKVAELAAKHSFNLTPNQQADLSKIISTVSTALNLNSDLVPELQNLRDAVLQTIDLRNLGNTDVDTNTGTDRYNFLTNVQNEYDAKYALPAFIGLSLVSPELKDALKTVNISKQLIKDITTPGSYGNSTVDRMLNSIGNKVITTIGDACAGKYKDNANAEQVLNTYLNTLQNDDLVKDRNKLINNLQGKYMDKVDDFTRELISKALSKFADQHLFSGSKSELGALANNIFENLPRAVSILFTKDGLSKADNLLRLLRNGMNRADEHPLGNNFLVHSFTNIMDELFAADKNKADLAQIQKKALASVQGIRQLYNELIPALLDKSFKQEGHRLLRQEKAKLYDALITTDLGALTNNQIDKLAHNKEDEVISSLEEELASKSGTLYKHYQRKAKQLAHYMVTDEPGANLLTNANTIAHLFGEGIKVTNIDPDVVNTIDALVSAYAYKELDSDTKKLFRDLTQSCPKSMLMAVNQQGGARQYDLDLINSSKDTKFAYIKGANNTTNAMDRKVLAVTSVPEMQRLQHLGYQLVHTSSGSILRDKNKKIYYMVCDIGNRANFNQGTLQNIVDTHGGVNVNTLVATSMSTAGYYRDPNIIAQYAHRLTHDTGKENFIATYDENGKVIFLHQALDPAVIKPYRASKDFLKSVGSWSGSQVESILAKQFNNKAIKALADQYRRESASAIKSRDYINLFDSKVLARNPVWRDAVRNINTTTRYMIEQQFGKGKFMVRRDLVDDVIGRRAMSVTDMFTGISNANPAVLHCAAKFCEMIMGQKAFKYLANTEYAVQTVMSWARNTIVVKSGLVPAMNACANAVQLMMRGVPINVIMTETPKIVRQLEQLNSSRRREVEIAMELARLQREGYAQHQAEVNRLTAEKRQLVTNREQLKLISPLVNAGEYNTIADIGLQQDTILPGKFGEYITDQLEKMPKPVVSTGKYLLVTKDTSLYKGLEKTVQYGDFVAKSIYYRHLLNKGLSEAEALRKVRYEFVNYDTMGGRAREYLENMGLLWFYNFKLRSTRVAYSMITENPLRALLSIMVPGADTFGTPIIDNVLAKIFSGTLPSSMGTNMFTGLWEKNLYNVLTDAF